MAGRWRGFGVMILALALAGLAGGAQGASAEVSFVLEAEASGGDPVPVRVRVDPLPWRAVAGLHLWAGEGDARRPLPVQSLAGTPGELWFMRAGSTAEEADGGLTRYTLGEGPPAEPEPAMGTRRNGRVLALLGLDGEPVLDFHYGVFPAPEGRDAAYARSGFIHPLRTPSGEVLTQIQPSGHWHHYGLWNPWTRVAWREGVHDLWNLHAKQGTVRFVRFEAIEAGPVWAGFTALLEHVAFPAEGEEVVVLRERRTVRAYRRTAAAPQLVDLVLDFENVTGEELTLEAYRYGGLGFRGRADWNAESVTFLTSAGHGHADADGTRARWCRVTGATGRGLGTIAIFSHPENFNHPEPLRVWPPEMQEGRIFVNVSPIKDRPWPLPTGEVHRLRYRIVLADEALEPERLEAAWRLFAQPPRVVAR
jgi:hypothetical protein